MLFRMHWKKMRINFKMCGDIRGGGGGRGCGGGSGECALPVAWWGQWLDWVSVLLKEKFKLFFSGFYVGLFGLFVGFFVVFFLFFFPPSTGGFGRWIKLFSSPVELKRHVYAVLIWSQTWLSSLVSCFCHSDMQHLFWTWKMVLSP